MFLGVTHITPFLRYKRQSSGPSNYGLWIHTYSKFFCNEFILMVLITEPIWMLSVSSSSSSSNFIPNRIQQYNTACVTNITNSRVIIDIVMWFCWWAPEKQWTYQAGSHRRESCGSLVRINRYGSLYSRIGEYNHCIMIHVHVMQVISPFYIPILWKP